MVMQVSECTVIKQTERLCLTILSLCLLLQPLQAEIPQWWKDTHQYDGVSDWSEYMTYTSGFFGPNALPVFEISDGHVAACHQAEISTDFFWGFGDQTQSLSARFTYTFIPGRLAVTGWGVLAEHYQTTTAVRDLRASLVEDPEETVLIGDVYLSTQIGLLKEKRYVPDLMMEIILKTASSKSAAGARFFDTPGYCLNLAGGKSVLFSESFIHEIRFAGTIGFLCYQMNSRYQNDAPVYGAKVQFFSGPWMWENGFGGYDGWTGEGDNPQVLRSKLLYQMASMQYFVQYQHALKDYPFRRMQAGVVFDF